MAGSDHSADQGWTGPAPVMVLVRPQMGENIGAAARAMWNFGLDRMRIVAPRDGWPNERAVAMASGAARVLDHAKITPDTPSALDDLNMVYATTARVRGLVKDVLTPEAAMVDARARIGRGEKVGVIFGPERAGLENDDVARANAIISVPVNPAFGSLNLAQCVLLVAYEWVRSGGAVPAQPEQDHRPATAIELEKLGDHLDQALTDAHFFYPEDKAPHMRTNLRNLLSRLPLTDGDIRIFHGIIRALVRRETGE